MFSLTCITLDSGISSGFSFSSLCCGRVVSGYPMGMPHHFINIGERVEAVWHLLQMPDAAVVALVGMGGIGTIGILLFMLWYLWHLHGLNLDVVCTMPV